MGSNGSFPPPPPPGQPPPPGNWPPQQPGYQPTQQVPTTQVHPQQGYATVADAPKRNTGLLIGGGLIVIAALIAGGILLMGGDDDKKPSVTIAPITSTTAVDTSVLTTPETTVAPTLAPTTAAPTTVPDSTLTEFFDDTGTFSMILPNDLEIDTAVLVDLNGVEIPSIAAAESLAAYNTDDVTFGLTTVVVGPQIGSTPEQVMDFLEPVEGTCTTRVEDTVQTLHGLATRVSLAGCGAGGGNKVLMVVQLADRPVVLGVYMQGLADTVTLAPAAQSALESIVVF